MCMLDADNPRGRGRGWLLVSGTVRQLGSGAAGSGMGSRDRQFIQSG
jgi:hypothetical protein